MNKSLFQDSCDLLLGGFYETEIKTPQMHIVKSIFKDAAYNYIVIDNVRKLNGIQYAKNIVGKLSEDGTEFSYYVKKNLKSRFDDLKYSSDLLYDDLYVYLESKTKFDLDTKPVVEAELGDYQRFLKPAALCFPEWPNTEDFTRWCVECPNVHFFGIEEHGAVVSFGGYYYVDGRDLALIMNCGTAPEFRRKGYFDYLVRYIINHAGSMHGVTRFYANVERGGNSHRGFAKLGFVDGPRYFVYQS